MGTSRITVMLAVACLLVVTGCGGSDEQTEVDPGDAQTASPSTGGVDPDPDGGGKGDPAVSLPRLPVGGDADDVSGDGRAQCVDVRWSVQQNAADVPDGVQVRLTGVRFDPAVFVVAGDVCGSGTSCEAYSFDAGATGCVLGVRATDALAEDVEDARVSFAGSVSCSASQDRCADFLAAVAEETQLSIPLNFVDATALDDESGTDDGTPDETTDGTDETSEPPAGDEETADTDDGGTDDEGTGTDGSDQEPTDP